MPTLKVSRAVAKQKLDKQVDEGIRLANLPIQNQDQLDAMWNSEREWDRYTMELLGTLIVEKSAFENVFEGAGAGVVRYNASFTYYTDLFRKNINGKLSALSGLIRRIELFDEPQTASSISFIAEQKDKPTASGRSVFIVHGQDETAKQTVARFIDKLDLTAIILHEQISRGQTLIEKFERYAGQVDFAVVLLTPDDIGGPKSTQTIDALNPRARQNVVFELGFFVGALGLGRVFTLYKQGVEIPSDFTGVVYQLFDDVGGWRLPLVEELEAAGLEVDRRRL